MESTTTQTQPEPPSLHDLCKESLNTFRKLHIYVKTSGLPHKAFVDKLEEDLVEIARLFFSFRQDEIHIYGEFDLLMKTYNRYVSNKLEIGDKKFSFILYHPKKSTPYRVRFSGIGFPQIPNWETRLAVKLRRECRHGVRTTSHIANFTTLSEDLKKILADNRLRNIVQAVNFCQFCLDFYSSEPRKHVCKRSSPSLVPTSSTSTSTSTSTSSPTSTSTSTSTSMSTSISISTSTSPSTPPFHSDDNHVVQTTPKPPGDKAVSSPVVAKPSVAVRGDARHQISTSHRVDHAALSETGRHNGTTRAVDHSNTSDMCLQLDPPEATTVKEPSNGSSPLPIKCRFAGLPQSAIKAFFDLESQRVVLDQLGRTLLWQYRGSELVISGDKRHLDTFLHHFRTFTVKKRQLHFRWSLFDELDTNPTK